MPDSTVKTQPELNLPPLPSNPTTIKPVVNPEPQTPSPQAINDRALSEPIYSIPGIPGDQLPTPGTKEEVPGYLDNFQQMLFQGGGNVDFQFGAGTPMGDLERKLKPNIDKPNPPSLVDIYDQLRKDFNLDGLEQSLNSLEAQRVEVEDRLRQRADFQRSQKGVSLSVIGGRVGEVERQERENLYLIDRQTQTLNNQYNTANNVIQLYTQLFETDYQNARQFYTDAFQQNLALYQEVEGKRRFEKQFKEDVKRDKRDFNESKRRFDIEQKNQEQTFARANLQIYMDMFTNGNMTYDKLSNKQKRQINKLEIQAGLPAGFMSTVKMTPGANIKHIGTRVGADGNQYVDMLVLNPDGTYSTQSQFLGSVYRAPTGGGSSSTAEKKAYTQSQYNSAASIVSKIDSNNDNQLSTGEMVQAIQEIRRKFGTDDATAKQIFLDIFNNTGYNHYTPNTNTSPAETPAQTEPKKEKSAIQKFTDWITFWN